MEEATGALAAADEQGDYHSDISVTFASPRHAEIAVATLSVDQELQPDKVTKSFRIEESTVHVHFQAVDARMLRVTLSSFFDSALVVCRTLQEFGDGS